MHWVEFITGTGAFIGQLTVFLRWMRRRILDDAMRRQFVEDMATNHLPHIFAALEQIADALGITIEEPPAIGWINRKKRDGE